MQKMKQAQLAAGVSLEATFENDTTECVGGTYPMA